MLQQFKNLFRPRTALELAAAELAEAERSRLQALSAAEWAQSNALYHAQRIDRLRAFLSGEEQSECHG